MRYKMGHARASGLWVSTTQWTDQVKAEARLRDIAKVKTFWETHGRCPRMREASIGTKSIKRFGCWQNLMSAALSPETSTASHVLWSGELLPYGANEPYEVSGQSIRGGIEYDPASQFLKCHECGQFVRSLSFHGSRIHGIHAADYRVKHGLHRTSALIASRASLRANIQAIAAEKTLATREAKRAEVKSRQIEPIGQPQVIALLRAFRQRTGRFPSWQECLPSRRNNLPNRIAVRRCFGSYQNAYDAAFPVDPSDRRVLMHGHVWLYEIKAPYELSGQSIRGAIEYDLSSDRMKCHECGGFFRDLGRHIGKHDIKAATYKQKHGLRSSTALVGDEKRIALSESGRARIKAEDASGKMRSLALARKATPGEIARAVAARKAGLAERRNSTGGCREQCLAKILALAEILGRTPMGIELPPNGISLWDVAYHFGTVAGAMQIAGLRPRVRGARPQVNGKLKSKDKYPEDLLIRQMRLFFYNNKRIPRVTDLKRGYFTCGYHVFISHWGSWLNAIEVAFSPREIKRDQFFARKVSRPRRPTMPLTRQPEDLHL